MLADGQQLVHIALVTHVEHKAVHGCIEDVVHRNREFDYSEIRADVSASLGDTLDQPLPNLRGQLG